MTCITCFVAIESAEAPCQWQHAACGVRYFSAYFKLPVQFPCSLHRGSSCLVKLAHAATFLSGSLLLQLAWYAWHRPIQNRRVGPQGW
jgi:hypothetical protein